MKSRLHDDAAARRAPARGGRVVETVFRRKALVLAAFLIVAATMLNSLFGERGILGLWKAREEYSRLLSEVEALDEENDALSAQIHMLRTDPLVIERLARETLGSTGVGDGIAIPHVRNPVVLHVRPAVTLCFLEHPVDFGALDGIPARALFLLVSPTTRAHLHLLSRLGAALHDAELKRLVREQGGRDEILAAFRRVEAGFPRRGDGEPEPKEAPR